MGPRDFSFVANSIPPLRPGGRKGETKRIKEKKKEDKGKATKRGLLKELRLPVVSREAKSYGRRMVRHGIRSYGRPRSDKIGDTVLLG